MSKIEDENLKQYTNSIVSQEQISPKASNSPSAAATMANLINRGKMKRQRLIAKALNKSSNNSPAPENRYD